MSKSIWEFKFKPSTRNHYYLCKARGFWAQLKYESWSFCIPNTSIVDKGRWQSLEKEVLDYVHVMVLDRTYAAVLGRSVSCLGMQIKEWIWSNYVVQNELNIRGIIHSMYWTPHFTIDNPTTVEAMVNNDRLSVEFRFHLACVYCLEGYVESLWSRTYKTFQMNYNVRASHRQLVMYWCGIQSQMERQASWSNPNLAAGLAFPHLRKFGLSPESVLKNSVIVGNEDAVLYFWPKCEMLMDRLKLARLAVTRRWDESPKEFPPQSHSHILMFLFSKMTEQEIDVLFTDYPRLTLKCFLDWPFQEHFLETLRRKISKFSHQHCLDLLGDIAEKQVDGFKDYMYAPLFENCWTDLSAECQEYIKDHLDTSPVIDQLVRINDNYNLSELLKSCSHEQRRRVLFSERAKTVCKKLLLRENRIMFSNFVDLCLPKDCDERNFVLVDYRAQMMEALGEDGKRVLDTMRQVLDSLRDNAH